MRRRGEATCRRRRGEATSTSDPRDKRENVAATRSRRVRRSEQPQARSGEKRETASGESRRRSRWVRRSDRPRARRQTRDSRKFEGRSTGNSGIEVHVLCAVEYENEASFTHAKVFTEQPRHFSSLDGVLLARFTRGLAEAELRGLKMKRDESTETRFTGAGYGG